MTRERWAILLLGALYALVGTLEYEADERAEKRGAYAPQPAGEDADLWMW